MMIVRNTTSLPPFWNKSSEFLWTKPRSSALLPENNDSHKGSHRATNGRTHAGEIAEEKDCADYTIIHFNFFILSIIAVCLILQFRAHSFGMTALTLIFIRVRVHGQWR